MIEDLITGLPESWRELAGLLVMPIAWVPRLQQTLIAFFLESASPWAAAAKYLFLLLPLGLAVVAIWCTQLSLFTLPFRAGRSRFVSAILLAWWDAARVTWVYWAGVVRLAGVAIGWVLGLAHLVTRLASGLIRVVVSAPLVTTGATTSGYLRPGVPWVAFVMLVAWCALEAAVFAYTMLPTVAEVLADMVGTDDVPRLTGAFLYMLLLMIVLGSFAGLQALVDAVRKREPKFLAQIVLLQLLVMFFEVMFLYRELIDAITPWIAQETGFQMGLASTLLLSTLGWMGVRVTAWYLFGQYGTPPLLALIARQPAEPPLQIVGPAARGGWWQPAVEEFKGDVEWLHAKGDEVLEYLALPVLHLLGAALNFATILTSGRPVFALPFRSLQDVTERRDLLDATPLQPRKQASL